MPAKKRYTGERLSPQREAKMLELLCAGKSCGQVADFLGANWLTVRAVQWKHSSSIEQHKRLLAERSEDAASDALDLLHSKLIASGNKLTPSQLVPVYGVLVDKSLALRADPTIQVQHQHQHIHAHINECSFQELLDNLPSNPQLADQPTDNNPPVIPSDSD